MGIKAQLQYLNLYQWPFQEPKLEVPTIYKAYVREYPHKIWPYMVQYLHFRILKFSLIIGVRWGYIPTYGLAIYTLVIQRGLLGNPQEMEANPP